EGDRYSWRPVPSSTTPKAPTTTTGVLLEHLQDPTKAAKLWEAAEEALIEKEAAKLLQDPKNKGATIESLKAFVQPPSDEAIIAEVQRRAALQVKMQQALLGQVDGPRAQSPASGQAPAPGQAPQGWHPPMLLPEPPRP